MSGAHLHPFIQTFADLALAYCSYLSDRVVVYSGTPSVESFATAPESLLTGMNKFLASLEITFRRDPSNFRPRINKFNSQLDKEQKAAGTYL